MIHLLLIDHVDDWRINKSFDCNNMVCDIVEIDLFLLVFSQHPFGVLDVFVEIGSWL